jgi:hypothetical protein
VPNGRGRSKMEAGKLKAEGVKRGVLDVWLPVRRRCHSGLVIEVKAPGERNHTSPEQRWWIDFLERQGFMVAVYDNWRKAWNHLMAYLDRPDLVLPII